MQNNRWVGLHRFFQSGKDRIDGVRLHRFDFSPYLLIGPKSKRHGLFVCSLELAGIRFPPGAGIRPPGGVIFSMLDSFEIIKAHRELFGQGF
jgi:hypothetical protein